MAEFRKWRERERKEGARGRVALFLRFEMAAHEHWRITKGLDWPDRGLEYRTEGNIG